jgi:hypothetical protein
MQVLVINARRPPAELPRLMNQRVLTMACSKFASSSKNCMPFCNRAMRWPGATAPGAKEVLAATRLSFANVKAVCEKPAQHSMTFPGRPTGLVEAAGRARSKDHVGQRTQS